MSWQGIEGHDEIVEQFRTRLKLGRLASTFLFVGPDASESGRLQSNWPKGCCATHAILWNSALAANAIAACNC